MARFTDCIADIDLEVLDAVQGASPLPATQAAICPATESALVRQQAEVFPVPLADWWMALRDAKH